jgi:CRP-like cAMP-binding protein
MFAALDDHLEPLITKLGLLADLDKEDRAAIRALPVTLKPARPNCYLVREGDTATSCCLLIDGYACRHKAASNGSRQIVSFHHPGDLLDLQHLWLERADHNIQTISDAVVGWVPIAALRALSRDRPRIGEALWRDTLIDASIYREWVLNVGRRDAKQRIAHMLCEFAVRRQAAGLGSPEDFVLPMTQEHIADATGLTAIHVNRMLQALGNEGVIQREKRHIAIADWQRMRRVADFQPAYLHAASGAAARA